jgi:hypothetical protein
VGHRPSGTNALRCRDPSSYPATDAAKGRLVALGLTVIALGLAAVALLGPLGSDVIAYHVTTTLRSQTIGLDAASLVVVTPLALGAAVLALRHPLLGPVLALGNTTFDPPSRSTIGTGGATFTPLQRLGVIFGLRPRPDVESCSRGTFSG